MTLARQLAAFVTRSSWEEVSAEARQALKLRVLDSLGCALGALDGEPIASVRAQVEDFGGRPLCTLIGGGRSAPDRAALLNGALVRYLDFNDSYLAPGETCHPSDNLGAVLAAAEYAGASGRDFLTALAVAYQVQCRLSDEAPVRAKGFDHTTQGAYAVAAGVARALGLDDARTANAIAIAGTSLNALRVTRTGALSHWKGLAYPATALAGTHAAFLAMRGITGPPEVFEGNKGFMETIAGQFSIDWSRENLERVRRTILKRYNAEIHSQSTSRRYSSCASSTASPPPTSSGSRSRSSTSPTTSSAGARRATRRSLGQRRRPTTRCPTSLPSRCSTTGCNPSSSRPSGSCATTCRGCCAGSRCGRPRT